MTYRELSREHRLTAAASYLAARWADACGRYDYAEMFRKVADAAVDAYATSQRISDTMTLRKESA